MPLPPMTNSTDTHLAQRSLLSYCLERTTLLFALKIALVMGTVQTIINHTQAVLTVHFTSDLILPLCLTYLVPFAVSMFSQVQGKQQRDLEMSKAQLLEGEI